MNWISISTSLSLAIGFFILVVLHQWDACFAFATLGFGIVLIIMILLALLMLLAGKDGQEAVWSVFFDTLKQDRRDIVRFFTGKR